ncbi:mandelate racemase/muconate lactonizing enzyme family protein [Paenibacillus oryzisoli]|uniref:mandelate racemase/muconate lactonizing enzyme family protein n=1 Tax=Paenibacillus oryzisoli TaxID=1850517 RepID=UPI003D296B30
MKIRKVDTFPLLYRLPKPYGDANGMKRFRASYLIKIEADSGECGWGECVDSLGTLQITFRERIIPFLIGKPVADRRKLAQTVKKIHSRSASAVSMALAEITASYAGVHITDLWGGRYRDNVPIYASFQSYSEEHDWQKQSVLAVKKAAASGFNAFKVKIGGKSFQEDIRHINAIQDALSDHMFLALDANQSYDLAAASLWRSIMEKQSGFLWLEEPLQIKYAAEYGMLRQRLPVPLAGGENIESFADYIPLLTQRSVDYITPDPLHVAGIDEYRETLSMARAFGIRATPHTYDGALTRLYALFAQACLEPFSKMKPETIEPVEWDVMDNPFTQLIPIQPSNSEITLPYGAGIGLEIDQELLSYYLWDGSSYE